MRILVGYATGYGSTRSYAEVIGEELRQAGHETIVLEARQSRDIKDYDFVIIGGSIRAGNWLGPARNLARRAVELKKAHAIFFCCLSARSDEGKKTVVEDYFERVKGKVPGISPLEVGVFPGIANYEQYRFPVKQIMVGEGKDHGVDTSKNQDYRKLDDAREWARELNRLL
ncbi:hypothetical protein KAU45_01715 [bacterium]|nr:hypothetical protein [bacterium]